MSEQNGPNPNPELTEVVIGPPICPHCKGDLSQTMNFVERQYGPFQVFIISCPHTGCRKVFNVQILGMQQPKVVPATNFNPGMRM